MSDSTFFVSAAAVRNLKHRAQSHISGVSSAHLSEAMATALGFKTNAALRAALNGRTTVEVPKPSNARMVQRLQELGYSVTANLYLIPEFKHSYSPIRSFPLRKQRSTRWMGWRNLMVAAINAGLEQRLFGLEPGDNWWPGGNPVNHLCERHLYRFGLADGHTAVASVDAISGDELTIHVVLDPRHERIAPDQFNGLRDGDAHAHAWVERSLGAWIQDGGEDFSCKRAALPWLAQQTIKPLGYSDQGSFIM